MKNEERIERILPPLSKGLSKEQVEERKRLGLVNKTKVVVGKTYFVHYDNNMYNSICIV